MAQNICNGDVTALTIPQSFTDLIGSISMDQIPTLNQNTTGSSASCTGNAATATTASACSGNAATATVASGLTGTPAITVGAVTCTSVTGSSTVQGATVTSTGGLNAGSTKFAVNSSGLCTEYDGIACTGQGLPAAVGIVTTGTHTAAIVASNLLAAPVAGGFYRISAYMKITVATSTPVAGPITISYKDSDGVTQSVVMALHNAAGAIATSTGSTTTTPVMGQMPIYCGSGTAIQYAVAFSGTGTYELVLKCESF